MPKVYEVTDQPDLVSVSKFPLLDFPFETFNPVQSRLIEYYDQPVNVIVAASTSSGKTVCAEMLLSHEIKKRGGKGMYIGPLKALSQEKIDDWTDESHQFHDLNLSICTGDYRLTPNRRKELSESNIVLMTSEMLNSRTRNYQSEQNDWLTQVGTLVTDESHLITVPGRGDKLEVAIMKMASIRPDCRQVFLSATMPNVAEIGHWLTKLNDRDTIVISSDYRPCPLKIHYKPYDDSHWKYQTKEIEKVATALRIVKEYADDKFLVFVHTKDTGKMMVQALKSAGIDTEFHNADLSKEKRVKLEKKFREDRKFRVIVATSTLAIGLNMPARRVIVLGVHRGLSEVEVHEVCQMIGRAGRPKYDLQGDAYILVPHGHAGEQILRLQTPQPITSQIVKPNSNDTKTLAFHVVSEIANGNIVDVQGIYDWYNKTLAAFQRKNLSEDLVSKMISGLTSKGIIKRDGDDLSVTSIGRVSSLFYFSPYDVADLRKNFDILFDNGKELDDIWIATALAYIDSFKFGIVSAAEREQLAMFDQRLTYDLCKAFVGFKEFPDSVKKGIFCYYFLLQGRMNEVFASLMRNLKTDSERLIEILTAIDGMSAKWDQSDYFKTLGMRLQYGVTPELIELCSIKGIGQAKAKKLWKANIKTAEEILRKPTVVKIALGCSDKVLEKMIKDVQSSLMTS